MSLVKNQLSSFNDWVEVDSALNDEIKAAQEKQTEISLFNGKRKSEKDNIYYYKFSVNTDDRIQSDHITEIRYKNNVLEGASLIKITNKNAIIAIPKSIGHIPSTIPIIIIVNDPSFILQRLQEEIESLQHKEQPSGGFINSIFGTQADIKTVYSEQDLIVKGSFDYNDRQLEAIKKSVKNKLLFIWGPPGTGKTTVLGKIISDYVKKDESVLLCSNTNRAVDVSILKALEVSSFETTPIKEKSLRWGNVFLKEEEDLQYVTVENHLIRKKREKEKKIQKEVDLLDEFKEASKLLNDNRIKIRPYTLTKKRYEELLKLEELNAFQESEVERLKEKIKNIGGGKKSIQDKTTKLEENLNEIETKIKENFDSVNSLRQFVIEKTLVTMEEILLDIRFQASTFAKTVLDENLKLQQFDNVLIDEASMANLPYILYLSTFAKKRIIFVGDPQQLAPIVLSNGSLADKWLKKDIFLKVASVNEISELFRWQNENDDISVLLTDQYRMPQKIFNIVNDLFYNGRLVNRVENSGSIKVIDTSEINPILTFPSEKIKSPVNVDHSELLINDISKALESIDDKSDAAKSIGVMVPFTQQKRFTQYLSQIRNIPNSLEIGVVHTFQGREKPRVYFDLTLSNIDYTYPTFDEYKTSKMDVSRLLNVALSRCQSSDNKYFNGEFILLVNINYFKKFHPNGIVFEFINELIDNADEEIEKISEPINPFKLVEENHEQIDVFEQKAKQSTANKEEVSDQEEVADEEIAEIPDDKRIKKEIEKNCEIITREIQLINHFGNKIDHKEIFNYTSAINEVLAKLPVYYCTDKDSFKLFIDMMYKLIYEASGGKDASYPIWDRKAKLRYESYGKIRLVIHQLRQYYFHDYENWDQEEQDKLLAYVNEYFNSLIDGNEPEIEDEWSNCQLAILFKTTEYLIAVKNKYAKKIRK